MGLKHEGCPCILTWIPSNTRICSFQTRHGWGLIHSRLGVEVSGVQLVGGLEKILGVGLNFKNDICPAHFTSRTMKMKKKMQKKDLVKITWAIACEWACHKLSSWFAYLMHVLSICRRIFARLAIHDICVTCCFLDASLKLCICTASILRSCCLSSSYFSYIISR